MASPQNTYMNILIKVLDSNFYAPTFSVQKPSKCMKGGDHEDEITVVTERSTWGRWHSTVSYRPVPTSNLTV